MSREIIDGFRLTVKGSELIALAQERIDNIDGRLGQLEEAEKRVSAMAPEDREIAGLKMRSGDMGAEVRQKLEEAKSNRRFFAFVTEHLEADATYRLSYDSLRHFGVKAPSRY
tara:strand:+ start:57 stop:395 length:339 start_codon:yes stop_codon:yes gene_type:complete